MQSPPSSDTQPAAEKHHAAQIVLAALVARLIRHAFYRFLDPHNLRASTPKLVAAVEAIATHYGRAAAAAAVNEYRRAQHVAGGPANTRIPLPAPISRDEITRLVDDAVTGLYGNVTTDTVDVAEQHLEDSVSQLVFDQGTTALSNATLADTRAKGWARVPEPGCCAFCALLATRGPVYKAGSFTASNAQFTGPGDVKVHDHCRCGIEPVFNAYEPSAQIRDWQNLYNQSTGSVYGMKGKQKAFRRAFEGRSNAAPVPPKASGFMALTPDELRHQLAVLEPLKTSAYRTAQIARIRARLAVIG